MQKIDKIPEYCARGYAEVNLDAIISNVKHMKSVLREGTGMIGVIKTDGYGHGSAPIALALEKLDCMWGFAVATPEEAMLLRTEGIQKPVLILGYSFPYCYEMLAKEQIRPCVFREDSLPLLQEAAKRIGTKIKVHIKVDTGMGRIGIRPGEEGFAFVEKVLSYDSIEIEGMFTHFARADEEDKTHACEQLRRFTQFADDVEERFGLQIPFRHCSNSAGILELPEANLDLVRAGVTLYGLYPSEEVRRDTVELTPALSLYSHIVYIKTVPAGQPISYGGTFVTKRQMRVATIPMGYGDGYPRSLSNRGCVLIHGKRAPILGRVCMDQFMVDVTDIPEAAEGDPVVLLGYDGKEHLSAEELGELSGRFNYELVCDFGKRIPRIYTRQGDIIIE